MVEFIIVSFLSSFLAKRFNNKKTKWVDLIFEVEKFPIFQLRRLNQPEKIILMHAFCT